MTDDTPQQQSLFPPEVADVLAFFPVNPDKPEIRREWVDGRWYYAIIDILDHLAVAEKGASKYWSQLQDQMKTEGFVRARQDILQIVVRTHTDGKRRRTDFADRRTLFRLFQSIRNPKLEPFRQFLAQLGDEYLSDIEQEGQQAKPVVVPETTFLAMVDEFIGQGYGPDHAIARATDILVRNEWTDEVAHRGAEQPRDYIELTAILHKHTFGLTPSQHSDYKDLPPKTPLQSHLTIEELGLSTFTKTVHIGLARRNNTQGMDGLRTDAHRAGQAGQQARRIAEEALGGPIVSQENFLHLKGEKPRKQLPPSKSSKKQSRTNHLHEKPEEL